MEERRDDLLVETVVLAALGRRAELAEHLRDALSNGADPRRLREAILQVLPYAGFPRALSALLVLADATEGATGTAEEEPAPGEFRERGEVVFRTVYGDAADAILSNIARAHPSLPDWILGDAYGKVLARPGLDLATREVLGVALLTALDQPEQLQGHVRGGLRAGADPARLRDAVAIATRFVPPDAVGRAKDRLRRELE